MNLLSECEGILGKIGNCIGGQKEATKFDATKYASATAGDIANYAPSERKSAPSNQQPTLTKDEVDKDTNEEEDIDTEPEEKTSKLQKAVEKKPVAKLAAAKTAAKPAAKPEQPKVIQVNGNELTNYFQHATDQSQACC